MIKMFYEDLYKAFIFYVEHLRKVFIYECVTLKKMVKHTLKKFYNPNISKINGLTKHL